MARALLVRLLVQHPDAQRREVSVAYAAGDARTETMLLDLGLKTLHDYFEQFMYTKQEVQVCSNRVFLFSDTDVNFV